MQRPLKQFALLAAAGTAMFAAAAQAQPAHTTSMIHEGRSVTVTYEPQSSTNLKQSGLGPRMIARCLWSTTAWVERRVTDASGKTIAAMTRKIGERAAGEGNETGYCNTVAPSRTAAFGGDEAKLKAFVLAAADGDVGGLRAELASLDRLPAAS